MKRFVRCFTPPLAIINFEPSAGILLLTTFLDHQADSPSSKAGFTSKARLFALLLHLWVKENCETVKTSAMTGALS